MEAVKLYIFMDECQASPTMYDLVRSPTPMQPNEIREYMRQIVSGIGVLQKLGVAHRYIKLQHILFDMNNQLKLCGWSKAVFYYQVDAKKLLLQNVERRVRRNYFLPPEAFQRQYDPSKADIWSLGVLLVAMCTKRYPFNVRDERTKFSNQWRDFVRKHEMNVHVRNLCNRIFSIDPKNRIECDRILADRYFDVPTTKLIPLSIKASTELIERESSRIGAISAVDLGQSDGQIMGKTSDNEIQATTMAEGEEIVGEGEEVADVDANTTEQRIQDGGAVGEEENLTAEEMVTESQMAENVAPEEEETKA